MPRKSRSKPKNSKVNNMNDNLLLIDEHSHDLNGGSSLGDVNSSTLPINEISKKRQADVYDDPNDSSYDEVGPPRKKNYPDKKKGTKRQLSSSEDEDLRKTKAQKIDLNNDDDGVINIGERVWKAASISSANCSNAQKISENSQFIIATYNILLNKQIKQHVIKSSRKYDSLDKNIGIKHVQLMDELDFLKADILCLQQVNYTYWKDTLERALKERGYISDIVIGDNISNIGVLTLYRSSRFIKVDIDCNKLSKLCIELIPANNDLDETTLNSIKQYLDEPDSYIITVLKDTQMKDERLLIVGNTHLSSPSIDKQDLRCVQAVGMFWKIHEMITQIKADLINNNSTPDQQQHFVSPCWILCGDFNSDPNSPVYQICRDGYPDERSIKKLQSLRKVRLGTSQDSSSLVDLIWHSFQHPLTDSCSSYVKVVSCEPGNDYIWMSEQGLHPSKVLMPCSSEYQQFQSSTSTTSASPAVSTAVTNNNRSFVVSDHLSLACHVSFMT